MASEAVQSKESKAFESKESNIDASSPVRRIICTYGYDISFILPPSSVSVNVAGSTATRHAVSGSVKISSLFLLNLCVNWFCV